MRGSGRSLSRLRTPYETGSFHRCQVHEILKLSGLSGLQSMCNITLASRELQLARPFDAEERR
ncbi:MAG: hypothetical protein ACE5E1_08425, partial [Phycisphaerae bacterium]